MIAFILPTLPSLILYHGFDYSFVPRYQSGLVISMMINKSSSEHVGQCLPEASLQLASGLMGQNYVDKFYRASEIN